MKISHFLWCVVALLFIAFLFFLIAASNRKEQALVIPLGLPPISWPADNPYDSKKAELGRLLYFDKRLSSDGTISCASCHSIPRAFTDQRSLPVGIKGRVGPRHTPTVINSVYQTLYFWDGRASSLEEQCKGPLANPNEMTLINDMHDAHQKCEESVKQIPGYRKLFKEVFGNDKCSVEEIAQAIATYERTILSGNSPFDRFQAGDATAMSREQIEGYAVFKRAGCMNCHYGPNFTDGRFLNIGIGMEAEHPDLGRYLITHKDRDWGAFKVPTLRDTAQTHPYMHNGSLKTLEEVIDYYDKGGTPNRNLHRLMQPLHLSEQDKKNLVSFLNSLSGEGWQHFTEPEQFP